MKEALLIWFCLENIKLGGKRRRGKDLEVKDLEVTRDIAVMLGWNERGHMVISRTQGTDEMPTQSMIGELQILQEGVPIWGEVVKITACSDGDASHWHVETVIEDPFKAHRLKPNSSVKRASKNPGPGPSATRKPDPSEYN